MRILFRTLFLHRQVTRHCCWGCFPPAETSVSTVMPPGFSIGPNNELIPAYGRQLTGDITESALFKQGSRFRTTDHTGLFYEGRMDRCADFGYEIEVISLAQENGEYVATVQITRTGN